MSAADLRRPEIIGSRQYHNEQCALKCFESDGLQIDIIDPQQVKRQTDSELSVTINVLQDVHQKDNNGNITDHYESVLVENVTKSPSPLTPSKYYVTGLTPKRVSTEYNGTVNDHLFESDLSGGDFHDNNTVNTPKHINRVSMNSLSTYPKYTGNISFRMSFCILHCIICMHCLCLLDQLVSFT